MTKKILITGATKGIGWALAQKAYSYGYDVILHGRNATELQQRKLELAPQGERCTTVCFDVRDRKILEQELQKIDRLNVLVNNAGTIADNWWSKMTDEQWDTVIATDLTGVYNVTSRLTAKIVPGGHIVNITSQAGLKGNPGQANYSAAKAALVGMTYTLAAELKRKQIYVNAVAPAAITAMTRPVLEKFRQKNGSLPSMWQLGTAAQVADFIIQHVLSTQKTGQVLAVNGTRQGYWLPAQYQRMEER
ncbi:SDR family NAD(P)-dependent oxidoreductase [Liquorilactobacillus satsumensis]|uniref:3-oxoacyl-ACP reductase n=1 Tax=Liquorilactobacillus satsumensis DSM 16230 = JCM 12392 TaxID=1423801 RepID=A0A0R1V0R7_9LACO|nr:SDR family NAD(P)-dependent oxidoreductase [Liquorilactobacillus satsumensis]KRL96963.1 3-oxoacyl-ACP reductase [Liquorilactobacillus satsumensis DSM 16230 = JCM 12392]